jgi:hypothetical protein
VDNHHRAPPPEHTEGTTTRTPSEGTNATTPPLEQQCDLSKMESKHEFKRISEPSNSRRRDIEIKVLTFGHGDVVRAKIGLVDVVS